jgi:FecR protein
MRSHQSDPDLSGCARLQPMDPFRGDSMPRSGRLIPAFVYAAVVLAPLTAAGQTAPAGVVTALQGQATVVRTATTEPAPLKFKDDVFVHDRIKTGDQTIARILLGGRATVTVRERTVLTITEQPGVSRINVGAGRAAVAAVKSRMKPGETIDIVTPHAVATIRGTVVVAEVTTAGSSITVLRGLVDVRQLDPSTQRPIGVVLHVGPLQRVNLPNGAAPKTQALTPEAGQRLGSQFKVGPRETPAGVHEAMIETQVRTAVTEISKLSSAVPAVDASPSASVASRDETKGAIGTLSTRSSDLSVKSSTTAIAVTSPTALAPAVGTLSLTTSTATIAPTTTTTPLLTTTTTVTSSTLTSAGQLVTAPTRTLLGQPVATPTVPTTSLTNTGSNLLGTLTK